MMSRCHACQAPKQGRQYLCHRCWFALPVITRRRLNWADEDAAMRLMEFYRQIDNGVPPGQVRVSP